jgi:hypothetical protein
MDALTREPDAREPATIRPKARAGRGVMTLLCLLVVAGRV